jgi:hypothetical protein
MLSLNQLIDRHQLREIRRCAADEKLFVVNKRYSFQRDRITPSGLMMPHSLPSLRMLETPSLDNRAIQTFKHIYRTTISLYPNVVGSQ